MGFQRLDDIGGEWPHACIVPVVTELNQRVRTIDNPFFKMRLQNRLGPDQRLQIIEIDFESLAGPITQGEIITKYMVPMGSHVSHILLLGVIGNGIEGIRSLSKSRLQ